jgi:hypothetical protein
MYLELDDIGFKIPGVLPPASHEMVEDVSVRWPARDAVDHYRPNNRPAIAQDDGAPHRVQERVARGWRLP